MARWGIRLNRAASLRVDRSLEKPYNGPVLARAILRASLRSIGAPPAVLLILAFGLLAPALTALDPFAHTVITSFPRPFIYNVVFPAVLFAALSLHRAGDQAWWLHRLVSEQRWAAGFALIYLGTWLPTCLVGWLQAPSFAVGAREVLRTGWIASWVALNLSSLGLVLMQLVLPGALRPILLVALSWFLPALLGGRGFLALTAVSIPGASGLSTRMTPSPVEIAPILALLLAAWLLGLRSVPRP